MTQIPIRQVFIRAVALTAFAASVSACATTTPAYPVREGYVAPPAAEMARPQYPVRREDATSSGPTPSAYQDDEAPRLALTRISTQDVQTSALPAVAAPGSGDPAAPPAPTGATPHTPEHPTEATERPAPIEHMAPPEPPAPAAAAAPPPSPAPTYTPPPQTARTPPPSRPQGPRMAVTGPVVSSSGVYMTYEVAKGDHVDALARQFGTTRKAIVDASKLKPPYGLRPGQLIKIPVSKAYVVQSGDTLALIARRFDVQVAELTELNRGAGRDLTPGRRIALPATFRDRGPIRIPGQMAEASPRNNPPRPVPTAPPPAPAYNAHPGVGASNPPPPAAAAPAPPPYRPPPQVATNTPPPYQPPPARPMAQSPALSDADVTRAAGGRFIWPVRGDILTRFGPLGAGGRNDGLDIRAPQGSVVRAAAGGDVVYAGDQVPGFGNLVLVKHADGWVTAYAHLDKVSVSMRQSVTQGQEIGQVGISGGVTEPQLHFEVRYAPTPADKAKPVDPALVLPRG